MTTASYDYAGFIWQVKLKYLYMANPPNFTDLARKQRLAMNNRLSFNSVINGGSPASQNVAIPVPVPPFSYPNKLTFFNEDITFEGGYLTYSA
jgi:hypothetical protein